MQKRLLEVPLVTGVIDTGFPAHEKYASRLYDMAITDDNKVWVGGNGDELKLFDFQGNLHRIVNTTWNGYHLCMYNNKVVYTGYKAVEMISNNNTVMKMFTTGDWNPRGITSTASGDLLVCLNKDDQSKVVRYSSTYTVLQEIQYDSHCQPLYTTANYITENVNGDIIVSDLDKCAVIAVNRLGIFRYAYSGNDKRLLANTVASDIFGHVFVSDFMGIKIHMLDKDGRFMRYIIPEEGIKDPRGVCINGHGELIVGECKTGLAKIIKYIEE